MIDLFVGSASFEQRCLSIPRRIDISLVRRAVIGCNITYLSALTRNLDSMADLFSDRFRKLEVSAEDPVGSALNIASEFGSVFQGPGRRVVMDITSFTRESLLMILQFFRQHMRSCDSLELLYMHAREYSIGSDREAKWLSKGIMEVRSVLGYPGVMSASRRTHLIVMVGFEFDRAVDIVRVVEPTFVSLGFAHAGEQGTAGHQETNESVIEKLRHLFRTVESFQFSAYDASRTKVDLSMQVELHPDCNVVVAPMHTKISTVGASLLAFENERVQICYAPAKIYNVEHYSAPGDDYYWFSLHWSGEA